MALSLKRPGDVAPVDGARVAGSIQGRAGNMPTWGVGDPVVTAMSGLQQSMERYAKVYDDVQVNSYLQKKSAELNKLYNDPDTGLFFTRRGKQAEGMYDEYKAAMTEMWDKDAKENLSPHQRALLSKPMQQLVTDYAHRVANYETSQKIDGAKADIANTVYEAKNLVASGQFTENDLGNALNSINISYDSLGKLNGWDAATIKRKQQEEAGDMLTKAAIGLAGTNPTAAIGMLKSYRSILPAAMYESALHAVFGGYEKYIEAFGVNGDMAGMDRAIAQAKEAARSMYGGYQGAGSISIKHESSGNPGTVSPDSFNSHSYGLFQFNSGKNDSGGTIHGFVEMLGKNPAYQGLYRGLAGKRIGSEDFNSAFKKVSKENSQLMEQAQREYLRQAYIYPAKRVLMSEPGTAAMLQRFEGNRAFEEMLISTAVGHGAGRTGGKDGAIAVFRNAWNSISPWLKGGTDNNVLLNALVDAVYNDRPRRYGSSSAKTQAAMAARYREEKEEVRALIGGSQNGPAGEDMRLTLFNSRLDRIRQAAEQKNEKEVMKEYPDVADKLKFGDTSAALNAATALESRGLFARAKVLRNAISVVEETKTERQWAAQAPLSALAARIQDLQKQADPDFPAMPHENLTRSEGIVEQGNIDLRKRPKVQLEDGSTASVRPMSFNIDGKEVLIPTISQDGREQSRDEAIAEYKRTGKHLGMFDTAEHAKAYAEALRQNQEAESLGGRKKELVEYQKVNASLKAATEIFNARAKAYKDDPAAAALSDAGMVLPANATPDETARAVLDMQVKNGVTEGNRRILTKAQSEDLKAKWANADAQKKTAFLLGDDGIMKTYGAYSGKVMSELGLTPMDSMLANVLVNDPTKANSVRRLWEEYGAPKEKVPDIEKDDTVNNLWMSVKNNSEIFKAVSEQAKATNSPETWALAQDLSTVAHKMLKKGVPADEVKKALDMGCTFSVDSDRAIFLPGNVSEDTVDDAIKIFGEAAIKNASSVDTFGLKSEDVFKKMKSNGIWVNAPDGDGVVFVDKIAQAPFKNPDGSFVRISQYKLVNGKDAAEDQYAHAEEN